MIHCDNCGFTFPDKSSVAKTGRCEECGARLIVPAANNRAVRAAAVEQNKTSKYKKVVNNGKTTKQLARDSHPEKKSEENAADQEVMNEFNTNQADFKKAAAEVIPEPQITKNVIKKGLNIQGPRQISKKEQRESDFRTAPDSSSQKRDFIYKTDETQKEFVNYHKQADTQPVDEEYASIEQDDEEKNDDFEYNGSFYDDEELEDVPDLSAEIRFDASTNKRNLSRKDKKPESEYKKDDFENDDDANKFQKNRGKSQVLTGNPGPKDEKAEKLDIKDSMKQILDLTSNLVKKKKLSTETVHKTNDRNKQSNKKQKRLEKKEYDSDFSTNKDHYYDDTVLIELPPPDKIPIWSILRVVFLLAAMFLLTVFFIYYV